MQKHSPRQVKTRNRIEFRSKTGAELITFKLKSNEKIFFSN